MLENKMSLTEFLVNEARGKKAETVSSEKVVDGGKVKDKDKAIEKVEGKPAESNGSKGTWAVDEPTDDDVLDNSDPSVFSKNEKRLKMRFAANKDFFILGHAGWGKTSIIESIAKKYKRSIITVYLDKAMASDLGGIPVPVKSEDGVTRIEQAMPAWAAYMHEHPEKKFLLFFDEMNQAAPDVQNALMPIVLKKVICGVQFDNYIVGAAGNYSDENSAVEELSGPLKSRFAPIITWDDGTQEAWDDSFKYLHKKWDGKLGKEFVDSIETYRDIFANPREVDDKLFDYVYNVKQSGEASIYDVDDYLDYITPLAKEGLGRSVDIDLKKIAEIIWNWENQSESKKTSGRSNMQMLDPDTAEAIKKIIKKGWYLDETTNTKYGVAEENFFEMTAEVWDGNREQMERFIQGAIASGIEWKYKKVKDFPSNLKTYQG